MAVRRISTKLAIDGESEYRASLSKINSEIKTLQSALKLTASEFKNNANSMEALTAKGDALSKLYNAQQEKVKELKSALDNARKAEEQYAAQKATLSDKIEENNRKLTALRSTTEDTSEEEAKLVLENKELAAQLEKSTAGLEASAKGANNWETKLNSAQIELNDLNSQLQLNDEYLREARNSTDGCAESIDRFGNRIENSKEQANGLRNALAAAGVIAALNELKDAFVACAEASIKYESAMAGVAKTTDLTDFELSAMRDSLRNLSTVIPTTASDLAGITEAAGQLGIAKDNLVEFTTVMANLGVATNLTSTEAATALARFANVVGTSADKYENLGSTIVALGNDFATTESEIVSMSTRLSAAGSIVGLSEAQIMGLATAMSSVGLEAEAGGSAMSKLLKQFEVMVATNSERLESFSRIAGMTASEFAKAWKTDPVIALSAFLQGLGKINKEGGSVAATLADLDIKEIRLSNAVTSLASSGDLLVNALNVANKAWTENTALTKEAQTRYETTESKLQLLANAADNAKISIGDRLSPAIGDFAETGADALNWISGIIDESEILIPTISGATAAIGTATGSIIALTAAVKLYEAAQSALSIIGAANPILLIATAAAAATAGIAVFTATIKDDAIPSVKELTEKSRELKSTVSESEESYANTADSISGTTEIVKQYINRLKELETQGLNTEEVQNEYLVTVDKINALMPGLNVEIDAQTGKTKESTEALIENADAWEKVNMQEAMQTKYKDQLAAMSAATIELAENQSKLNTLKEKVNQITEEQTAAEERMTEIAKEEAEILKDTSLGYEEQMAKIAALKDESNSLAQSKLEYFDVLQQLGEEETVYQEAIDRNNAVLSENERILTEAKAAVEEYTAAQSDTTQNSAAQQAAIEDINTSLEELAQAYSTAYQSAYDSIDSQIGLFDTFAAKVSEDTDTVEEMIARWNEQTQNLATYTENLRKAGEYGLDEGLVTSLSDGSAESAGYLQTIITKIEELGGSTEGLSTDAATFVSDFNESFKSTKEAKESFAKTTASIQTNLKEVVAQIESEAAAVDFSGFSEALKNAFGNVGFDFDEVGKNAGIGLKSGIDSSTTDVKLSASKLAEEVISTIKTTLDEHSPSKKTEEAGQNVGKGLAQGEDKSKPEVKKASENLGNEVVKTLEEKAKEAIRRFDSNFKTISSKARSALNDLKSSISSATASLPDEMYSVGANATQGMINGVYSRSSSLYWAMTSITNEAIASARRAAATASPSKKTTKIFEDVGEGMVVGVQHKKDRVKAAVDDVVDNALEIETKNNYAIENAINMTATLPTDMTKYIQDSPLMNRDGLRSMLTDVISQLTVTMDGKTVGYITGPYVATWQANELRRR